MCVAIKERLDQLTRPDMIQLLPIITVRIFRKNSLVFSSLLEAVAIPSITILYINIEDLGETRR